MFNLVRDNKVLARKVLRDIKKWLSHSEIQLYGRDVHTYFQTDFYKMNTMYKGYSHIYIYMYTRYLMIVLLLLRIKIEY